ncbi:MAG: DNA-deoxyinosine glycosylase [Clostridiales bacterium]|jgi:hypoxanthine-DNA glycosylase|nr:DNA-deoxyinosine glycosylase [Clostridiales bacterium]
MTLVHHPFPPVYDARSSLLILGSFPSVVSRETMFYYGNRNNRFWPLMARLFQRDLPEAIAEKREFLLDHGIALWDVVASCRVSGSSDSSIQSPAINPIGSLVAKTVVQAVFLNGQKAASLYMQHAAEIVGLPAFTLPSTSPANAAWGMERLATAWAAILPYAQHQPPIE